MPKHFLFLQLESKMFCWISILKKTKKTGFFVHLGHQMGSKSLRTTVFWLAATPSETPSQMPSETPSEMPSETPSETPGETPVATPVVTPVVTPVATVEILEHYPELIASKACSCDVCSWWLQLIDPTCWDATLCVGGCYLWEFQSIRLVWSDQQISILISNGWRICRLCK